MGLPFTVRASRGQYIEVIEDTPQVPYVSLQVPDDTILVTKVQTWESVKPGVPKEVKGDYSETKILKVR